MMSDEVWLNIGSGTHPAPPPWRNVDQRPDAPQVDHVIPDGNPLSTRYPLGSVARIYLGHVLEHVAWEDIPRFLGDCRMLLRDGGELGIVGPDSWRALNMWRQGKLNRTLLAQILEADEHPDMVSAGTRHMWNASGKRTAKAVTAAGFTVKVYEVGMMPQPWPVTARQAVWQFAMVATK